MTTLTITPNYTHKTARFSGTIAAGEKVLTEIVGASAWVAPSGTQTLRLRVIFGNKLITKFPFYTEEDVEAGTVLIADQWDTSGTNPKCVLNLNTIPAAKMVGGGMCLWILDDPTNDILYAADMHEILPWHKEEGGDEPYDLDEYPDVIAELRDSIAVLESGKQGVLSPAQVAAVDSGITAALVQKLDGMAADGEKNVQADWEETNPAKDSFIRNKPELAGVATSGDYEDLTNSPELANVALTGNYNDLVGLPDPKGYVRISGGKVQAVIPG